MDPTAAAVLEQVAALGRMNAAAEFVDRNLAEGHGSRPALVLPDRCFTYAEVADRVNRLGSGLRSLGVEVENRVLLVLPDGVEFAAAYWGAMKVGAVPVPVNGSLAPEELLFMLEDSRAGVLVTDAGHWPRLRPLAARAAHLRHVVLVGEETPAPSGQVPVHGWHELLAAAPGQLAPELVDRDDMAYWLYSSGTTGFPKGVVHLHHDLLCCRLFAGAVMGLGRDDVVFSTSKLFFAYALGTSLHMASYHGATALLWPGRPRPREIAAYVEERAPTIFCSVPTFYAALLRSEEVRPEQFRSVRLCLSAGEPLSAQLYRRWRERFGVELCDGIGTTELTYTFISNRPGRVRTGSSGEVVPGNRVRIVDDTGRDVPDGERGHLLVDAESTCAHYWRQHRRNRESFEGRWFRTGDVYARDPDGFYYYVGRSDDLFKVHGQWLSPVEVENLLLEHPAVAEAAVVGCPDESGNLLPVAYVVPCGGFAPDAELARSLQDHVARCTQRWKSPRRVEFLTELPRTATGKVQRYRLRRP
jgi:benzoate-CoA ligase family protein